MKILDVNKLHISIANGSHTLVNDCSFSLSAGEVLGIIGPNGAGKSSLIKAIDGGLKHQGTLQFNGIQSQAKLRARQIAVLPQQSILNFPFTVAEVVELGRIPHATGKQRDLQIVAEALELMDISYLSDRRYTELSGGEKQRTQLARVFCQIWEPETDYPNRLLLLDEPTTALDLGHQHYLMQAIRRFADKGVSIIMVLHDINLAARYSDKLLALLCSEQIAFGSPEQVITSDIMSRLYGIPVEILTSKQSGAPIISGAL